MSSAISITTAIRNTDEHLRRSLPPIVSFAEDGEARTSYNVVVDDTVVEWVEHEPLTMDIIHQIVELPYVSHYYYTRAVSLQSPYIQQYTPVGADDLSISFSCWDLPTGGMDCFPLSEVFRFIGTSDYKPIEMQQGLVQLVAGRTFENYERYQIENVFPTIISTSFAQLNGFNIGSTFSLNNYRRNEWLWEWFDPEYGHSHYYQFEVIGFFEVEEQQYIQRGYERNAANLQHAALNRIYAPNSVIEEVRNIINQRSYELLSGEEWFDSWINEEPTFMGLIVLNDPLELENFREAAEEMLPRFWYVDDLTNSYM